MKIEITGNPKEIKKLFDAIKGSNEQQSLDRIEQNIERFTGFGSTH